MDLGIHPLAAALSSKGTPTMTVHKTIAATILLAICAVLSPIATSHASADAFDGDDLIEWITVFGEPTDTPAPPPGTRHNYCALLLDRMATIVDEHQNGLDFMRSLGSVEWWAQFTQGSVHGFRLSFVRTNYSMSNCDQFKDMPTIG